MVGARPPAARSFLVLRRTLILNLAVSARLGSCDFDLPRATRLSSYGLTSPPSARLRRFPPPGLDDHGQTSRDETRQDRGWACRTGWSSSVTLGLPHREVLAQVV
jgi:hypothetical protein